MHTAGAPPSSSRAEITVSGEAGRIIDLYERHAAAFDAERGRSLAEKPWLDRFAAHVAPGGRVLDLGCGSGEPIARYLIEAGFALTGIDSSPTLVAMCRRRFPDAEWLVADMRALALDGRFHGIVAWDSVFHLDMDDQRAMFPRLAAQALPGVPLLFTSGPAEGEAIGSWRGEPLYHASLGAPEYERLLAASGFTVEAHRAEDPACGGHTVWLAKRAQDC
jgi:SAM-dependent methyltransferase